MKKVIIKKGDLITYQNGYTKFVNRPDKFEKYFDDELFNPIMNLQIVKIQRFKKRLFSYKLVTIYKKEISRWI